MSATAIFSKLNPIHFFMLLLFVLHVQNTSAGIWRGKRNAETARHIFSNFVDKNHDGLASQAEFVNFFVQFRQALQEQSQYAGWARLSAAQYRNKAAQEFRRKDINKNGFLTLHEMSRD